MRCSTRPTPSTAELEPDDDEKLAGLAEAGAGVAAERARMDGVSPAAAMKAARSTIWRAALDRRLANRNGPSALTLFERVKHQLTADDRLALEMPMQVAHNEQVAEQWIASQIGTDGPPLQERVDGDTSLSPDVSLIIRTRLDERETAEESAGMRRPGASTTRSPTLLASSRPIPTLTCRARSPGSRAPMTTKENLARPNRRASWQCRSPCSARLPEAPSTGSSD